MSERLGRDVGGWEGSKSLGWKKKLWAGGSDDLRMWSFPLNSSVLYHPNDDLVQLESPFFCFPPPNGVNSVLEELATWLTGPYPSRHSYGYKFLLCY